MREQWLSDLHQAGIVAILRKIEAAALPSLVSALVAGGIRVVEVTLNTAGALDMIRALARDPRLLPGAGTVLSPESARLAIQAGARLIVCPHVHPDIIRTAREQGALVIPGAMTPTEIVTAWDAGADVVKLFPAGTLGPSYVKEIKAPLDQVRLLATGGVTEENAGEFLRAGADLLGVGGALAPAAEVAAGDWAAISARARRLTELVGAVRRERRA